MSKSLKYKEAVMTEKPKGRDIVREEFSGLIEQFSELLKRYPGAAEHFSLAYHPTGSARNHREMLGAATTTGFTQPVFECEEFDAGTPWSFIVCNRVDEQ